MTWRDQKQLRDIAAFVSDEGKLFWAAKEFGKLRMKLRVDDYILEDLLMGAADKIGLRGQRALRQIRNGLRIGALAATEQRR
jgi:hypothetical protein